MLHLMPADELGEHFDPKLGCPTKELYGMAGAIFLKEFFNLTIPQTVERYLTDAAWQYALNVNPIEASLSHATVERYLKLFASSVTTGACTSRRMQISLLAMPRRRRSCSAASTALAPHCVKWSPKTCSCW